MIEILFIFSNSQFLNFNYTFPFPFYFSKERNLALQAPILHASTSGSPIIQGQYINTLSQNRNESINAPPSSNHTSTTTLTPLVNAKIHPQPQLSHEQINPSQYTVATIQQPSTIHSNNHHVQYPHALQAVLHQVSNPHFFFTNIYNLIWLLYKKLLFFFFFNIHIVATATLSIPTDSNRDRIIKRCNYSKRSSSFDNSHKCKPK